MDWQPIETAPKNGSIIDVWVNDSYRGYRVPSVKWHDGEWVTRTSPVEGFFDVATGEPLIRVTYWMPLPSPPAASPATEESERT